MKRTIAVVAALALALALAAWLRSRQRATETDAGSAASSAEVHEQGGRPSSSADPARRYPHAVRDQAKRDELRAKILAAAAEAEATAKAEAAQAAAAGQAPAGRGARQTDDIQEFGKFAAQAIREDFIPMARGCAQELHGRRPDAGGAARVAFELLGDKKIGGVVNSAEVDGDKSTVHDVAFETCMRESMYGVYFDPPPANVRATLNFDVTIYEDGGIDEEVEDFHPRDRRGEGPTQR